MNLRLSVAAAIAVVLASLSLSSVIASGGWIPAGIAATAVVAGAGLATRLSRLTSAAIVTVLVLAAVIPLLTRPGWGERAAGLAIVAVVALSATGQRLLRAVATVAGDLAALLLYLNLIFAHSSAYGFLIPSARSVSVLGDLWRSAFALFQYAPPIPDIPAVSLVTSAGVGVVAITVDLIAVRLRRPALAGIPLLVLYSVPVASNLKVFGAPQMVIFAISLAGYLALLSADSRERLRLWGRLVTFRHVQTADEAGAGPDTSELAASGRRIGLAAVCLAIVVPVILPTVHAHDIFGTNQTGNGAGATAAVSPLLTMQSQLEAKPSPVLSYTTTAADPHEQYFQVYVLNYSARHNRWQTSLSADDRSLNGGPLPWSPQGVTKTTKVTSVTTSVQISKNESGPAVLPMPYAPQELYSAGGGWQETAGTLMVFSPTVSLNSLSYRVVSREADPKASAIPDESPPGAISAQYAGYTGPDSIRLQQIATAHTGGALTPLAQALALQRWFLSGAFTYSLKPDLPSGNWLLSFLTTDKRGFCSQFAQAFAVLARELGIPSRIAIGYTGGSPGLGRTWEVTTADAHAWPELYFAGEGWLRFEPTPAGVRGQGTADVPTYAGGAPVAGGPAPGSGGQTSPGGATGPTSPDRRRILNRLAHETQGGTGGPAAARRAHGGSLAWVGIVVPVLLIGLVAWPMLTRQLTRRRRWYTARTDLSRAHVAWRELTDDLADYGLGAPPGETPRSLTRRVSAEAGLSPDAASALARITAAEEQACYARAPRPGDGLRADSATVRRAMAASVSRGNRLRARLMPASTVQAARRASQQASNMLSWLDESWPAFGRQLRGLARRRTRPSES